MTQKIKITSIEIKDIEVSCLKDYFHAEIIGSKDRKFSWWKVLRRARRSKRCNFIFWWRIANYLHTKKGTLKSLSNTLGNRMVSKHNMEVMLGAEIDEGFVIGHNVGIVIAKNVKIGKNFTIRQNCTIGLDDKSNEPIVIGDNVEMGANSCIIGSGITIGDNVTLGAMSFVNKDIPSDSIVITKKETIIKHK
ncbi:MAG: serine acetyltransferase [gamma proteobacterium symbiont of Bathyaustriella thionipta]|nr:serine acetyltransferase [gamma proteobacterium symbiont of Bathyaustriella thionipta]MCU7950621.1 serine acetyltransferase [gamma proteobacterium symbiont of Bathyaustriella thionipta]MCU7954765.1 serine acetyltransferase [gamma proteobacterium symbiont of Bathyaustriella thionipta]MCU7957124.1 serine acetyltransferase [gamma proteobacterium symbiont of Bathyaustriella thionipta]MCU7968961.1 serine acetyltransferase [gamma proteobacterium symbiont of Bathyaustriella thionipta]